MFTRGVFILYKFVKPAAALLAAFIMCGCNRIAEEAPVQTEITQAAEKPYPITVGSLIFNEQPQTAGSLSPAITEMICELGYSENLIGRSSYCDFPENISEKADLGSAANPDVDAVIAAAPQLLISQSPIAKKDIVKIEEGGTRVMIISAPKSIEQLYNQYKDIAAVFGGKLTCSEAADKAIRPLSDALRKAENSIESFVYIMSPDLAVATNEDFAGNFFSKFGENAVSAADSDEATVLDAEQLAELSPQWLIMPESVESALPDEVKALDAYQDGKVITLDDEALERIERPTSRLSETVYDILGQINSINNA